MRSKEKIQKRNMEISSSLQHTTEGGRGKEERE
jgi:hypothetical protein